MLFRSRKQIINKFKKAIRNEQLKVTPQRVAVLDDLMDHPGHRECDEIFDDLRANDMKVSRATIYRTLDLLVKYGFAKKLNTGEGRSRFENRIDTHHHDHIICNKCGTITEFCNDEIEKIQIDICNDMDAQIVGHEHQLFVICADCRNN